MIATVAAILLGEQSAFARLVYKPILEDLATRIGTSNVVWIVTALMLAGGILSSPRWDAWSAL